MGRHLNAAHYDDAITVRCHKSDRERWDGAARWRGLDLSELVRRLLNEAARPEPEQEDAPEAGPQHDHERRCLTCRFARWEKTGHPTPRVNRGRPGECAKALPALNVPACVDVRAPRAPIWPNDLQGRGCPCWESLETSTKIRNLI